MPIKVLVIDDDKAMTDLLTLLLRSQDFEVFSANNGEDGLQFLREKNPDLVILDLMMNGMNGWEVCSEVRKFSRTPILVLSALDSPSKVASVLDAGADDYLVKPVSSGVLVAHINRLTHRKGTNPQLSTAYRAVSTLP